MCLAFEDGTTLGAIAGRRFGQKPEILTSVEAVETFGVVGRYGESR
jgi:hypothetical protein